MKTIIFHGLLKKLFCQQIKMNVINFKDIFKSLSCNYLDYNKKINKIKKTCCGLAVIVDGKLFHKDYEFVDHDIKDAKTIEIIPCSKINIFAALVATLVSIGLSKLLANIVAFLLVMLISFGISYLISKLIGGKGPGNGIKTSSYLFSNRENLAARNTPISLSYGRLKLGSSVINGLIFNFDLKFDSTTVLTQQNISAGLTSASI